MILVTMTGAKSGRERRRLFDAQAAVMPQFAEYEKNAAPREIQVFRITKN